MRSAIYAGSFDPFTLGHSDVINKALKIFDKVYVAIAVNPAKECMFTSEARRKMLEIALKPYLESERCDIVVLYNEDIVIDLAHNLGCSHLIRGIRDQNDIPHERMIYDVNKSISRKIETIFIMSDTTLVTVSSSLVRNIIKYTDRYNNFSYSKLDMLSEYMPYDVAKYIWENCLKGKF